MPHTTSHGDLLYTLHKLSESSGCANLTRMAYVDDGCPYLVSGSGLAWRDPSRQLDSPLDLTPGVHALASSASFPPVIATYACAPFFEVRQW
jgi:hypothetical protein